MILDAILMSSILLASVGVAVAGVVPTIAKDRAQRRVRALTAAAIPAVGVLTFSSLVVIAAEITAVSTALELPGHVWLSAVAISAAMCVGCVVLWLQDGKRF